MHNIVVTGTNGSLSCKTANRLKAEKDFVVKQLSLKNNLWENGDFGDIDSIVHIAGVTPQNAKSESDYESINFLLTKKLSDKAKRSGVGQFIYISSMAVYGMLPDINPAKGIVTESTPCSPADEYGKSKLKAEEYLRSISDDAFRVSIIRVPSVFDSEKTEYINQYKYLADKLPFIPKAFTKNYKSFIHSDNLCELICLAISNNHEGIICPDDGCFSAFDICSAIYPDKPKFRICGKLIELFLKNNPRIEDYYGSICYSKDLTNVFNCDYRVTHTLDAIRKLYEK